MRKVLQLLTDLAVQLGPFLVGTSIKEELARPVLEFILLEGQSNTKNSLILEPNLNRGSTADVNNWIQSQSYPSCSSPSDAEYMSSRFCLRVEILACCVGRSPFPIWLYRELHKSVIEKRRFHSRFKSSMNNRDYEEFRELRCWCKELLRQCHSSYIARVEEN
ncbi:hypothetical protein J6590_056801 [Homalodisca vitripennis]|nr:hypothetical protein J6590_056801 [Homalodisca vitripennis]